MGLVFLEGVAITVLVLTGFREAIFKAIPLELKKAIVVGIGFFILFIGLVDGGIVKVGGGTPVTLGASSACRSRSRIFGLAVTIIMIDPRLARRSHPRHHLAPPSSRPSS